MMYLLTCCMSRRNCYELDMDEDSSSFERFNYRNVSIRMSKRMQEKKVEKPVTGMGKFRASQKLKRKAIEETQNRIKAKAELRQRLKKCQSQPALRVKNYTPYDA